MSEALTVGLAQVNPVVGDIDGNVERIRALRRAADGEDLLVFGELALAGYPPEDLVLKRAFQDRDRAGGVDARRRHRRRRAGAADRRALALATARCIMRRCCWRAAASRRCG